MHLAASIDNLKSHVSTGSGDQEKLLWYCKCWRFIFFQGTSQSWRSGNLRNSLSSANLLYNFVCSYVFESWFPSNIHKNFRCLYFCLFRFQVGDFSGYNMKMLLLTLLLMIICSHVSVNQHSGKEKNEKNYFLNFHYGK